MASCSSVQPRVSHSSRMGEKEMTEKLFKWASEGLLPVKPLWNRKNAQADPMQCGNYRPDYVFEQDTVVVIEEHDQNGHSNYNMRCELVRQGRVSLGYGGRPVHWIRYNPDHFSLDGQSVPDDKTRDAIHIQHLQSAFQNPDYENLIKVDYLFYRPMFGGEGGIVQSFKFPTIEDYCVWVEQVSDEGPLEALPSSSTRTNPKRAWLITYSATSPNITHFMLSEVQLIVDECYTLEQRGFKYTLISVPKRARHEQLVKCMMQLKEKHNIVLQEFLVLGCESISGFYSPNEELRDHQGFRLMLENLPGVHKWLETGDIYTNEASLMHKFVAPSGRSSLSKKVLIQLVKEKTEELNDKKRKLEEAESENSALQHQLALKESENKELQKSVEHLKEQNSALKALYHAASS